MKKTIATILLFCLMLTACGKSAPAETTAPTVETTVPTETAAPVSYPVPSDDKMPASDVDVDWGLTLAAEKVKSSGLTIRYTQSGGTPAGQLETGSYFLLERFDGEWTEVEMLPQEFEIAWSAIAYLIDPDGETEMAEDWSFLYGPLTPGWYRIGKEVMDFRGPGDYDTAVFYAYFEITK